MSILSRSKSFFKEKWVVLILSFFISGPAIYLFIKDAHYLTIEKVIESIPRKYAIAYEFDGKIKTIQFQKWESALQIMSFESNFSVINQWNIGGRMSDLEEKGILIEDIDGDHLPDLSFLQIIDEKIYLAVLPISLKTNYYHRYFLDSARFSNMDNYPIYLKEIKTFPKFHTDHKNIAVSIYMGHAKYPRKFYIIDFQNDIVHSSMTDGNGLTNLNVEDVDGDSLYEFFGTSFSPGNTRNQSELTFNDSSIYLMVFDENLEPEFPPVEFKSIYSQLFNFSFPTDSGNFYFTTIIDNSSPRRIFPTYLYDLKGNLVDSTFIGSSTIPSIFRKESTGIYAYTAEEEIYRISDFRNPELLKKIKDFNLKDLKFVNIEKDDGYFFNFLGDEAHIYDRNFKLMEDLRLSFVNPGAIRITSLSGNTMKKGSLLLQDMNQLIQISYKINHFWEYRFLLVLVFLLLGFYIMNGISFILSYQQNKKLEREKEITELRFNAVKNQLEPHFLFNSLNSIGHLLLTEERMKAYSYLESLSFLLRNAINNSSEIAVPIAEEILFTKKYLEIEKLRFEDKFDFEIIVDEDVNTEFPIPKMIIQLHSENAVKHGVLHMETGGEIEIRVK